MVYNHYKIRTADLLPSFWTMVDTFHNGDGWYWVLGLGTPFGPFETEGQAVSDARRNV
jgi:hypothetical protein